MTYAKIAVGIFLAVSTVLGALLVYGRVQYEFRYSFDTITLGARWVDIVGVLGKAEGKVQNLAVTPPHDTRDRYTNTVTYQADSYLFWRQSSVTYYVGFDADDAVTMTVIQFPNGDHHICQVKGRERNKYKYCNGS